MKPAKIWASDLKSRSRFTWRTLLAPTIWAFSTNLFAASLHVTIPARLEPLLSETWIPTEVVRPNDHFVADENFQEQVISNYEQKIDQLTTSPHPAQPN